MRKLLIILPWAIFSAANAAPEKEISYNAHIRSFLSDKCIACHGPDPKHREGDLRLDTPEGAYAPLKEGGSIFAIVPGNPQKSVIFERIDSKDPDDVMPPPHYHKTITKEERELLWQWVKQGAKYEPHWAYTPIKKSKSIAKTANPIDGFVKDRLAEQDLKQSPRAKSSVLLRRLSLDITGLPPTPEQVANFEKAAAKDFNKAYEAEVDRLLASPRYGERMAVPWLDAVRFADTVGFHGDQNARIFPYRDYVINAFNSNKPFDKFVTEQLAGDLLENPTTEQLIATGFNRLNLMSREGGIQVKEYMAKYAADRARAVGEALLGQTTACSECHDHKFDPISTKDFYSLAAFFDDMKQWGVYSNYGYTPNPDLKGWNNNASFPPELVLKSASKLSMIKRFEDSAIASLQNHPAPANLIKNWLAEIKPHIRTEDAWAPTIPAKIISTKKTPFQIKPDHSVEFTGTPKNGDHLTLELDLPHTHLGSLRLEALPGKDGSVGRGKNGSFAMVGPQAKVKKGEKAYRRPTFTFLIKDSDGNESPLNFNWSQADLFTAYRWRDGDFDGYEINSEWRSAPGRWEHPATLAKQPHTAVFSLDTPQQLPVGSKLIAKIYTPDVARLRVSITPFLDPIAGRKAAPESILNALEANSNPQLLKAAYHYSQGNRNRLPQAYRHSRSEIRKLRAGWDRSLITVRAPEKEWRTTRVLPRGDWQNENGEIVKPAVFHFLPSESLPKDKRLTRLDLAKWIVADENPLTARHFSNRLWKQFFGVGISNVLNDLGAQGEWPSHPKLLDWLASEFRESSWNVKHLVKLIVTSETYQQEAATRRDLVDIDPHNRLYAQQAARRLDAEFVRDNALAISGLLQTDYIGGPSVKPYQPPGYYAALNFPVRKYKASTDDRQYRRGVYMHIQRTFLHPMLANFDGPNRVECAADRLQANSPQQALTLLNDPSYTEAARSFAIQLMLDKKIKSDTDLIKHAYRRALSREPRSEELASLLEFIPKQRSNIAEGKDDPEKLLKIGLSPVPGGIDKKELAAVTQLCRVVLNLHETITRY